MTLLPLFLFPPVSYMRACSGEKTVFVDPQSYFHRQTYRNRYEIATANGRLKLVVPIENSARKQQGLMMKEVRISYDHPWQMQHIRTIKSAYNTASYFAFYEETLNAMLRKKHTFLLDLTFEALAFLTQHFSLKPVQIYDAVPEHRKEIYDATLKNTASGNELTYYQVFSERQSFMPDLSSLDLLFNAGPVDARRLLTQNPLILT